MINRNIIQLENGSMEWVNTVNITAENKKVLNEKDKLSTEFLEYATE